MQITTLVSAVTLAERGSPSIAESSPKRSPSLQVGQNQFLAACGPDLDPDIARDEEVHVAGRIVETDDCLSFIDLLPDATPLEAREIEIGHALEEGDLRQ
jgi:hypothetical protein